ncbi:MAG: endo alpha-1,4 polygalactosaminidase [Candidatus Eremiobacteraeota bacterium]|nr:endo alpha-1,4 polygalactosaminidase [Candidatus Eremiobacteraeota bacterium]
MRTTLGLLALLGLVCQPALGRDWQAVRTFAYQLQGCDFAQLRQSDFDLLVMDYSRDGHADNRYQSDEIASLRSDRPCLVLAYLSIGEAEEYRFYWKPDFRPGNPAWLLPPNPNWPDNYKVRYWDPEWQAIIGDYVDQILEAGFDGLYLDLVDSYQHFPDRPQARQEMIDFVSHLAGHARAKGGDDFGIFPQNGEELLEDPAYLDLITGIGKESTYFGYPSDEVASDPEWTAEVEQRLDRAVAAGKLVLNVDYTGRVDQARQATRRAHARGYREFIAVRELDQIQVALNPVPETNLVGPIALGLLLLVLVGWLVRWRLRRR